MTVEPRQAASLILLRESADGAEVLLVQRNPQQRFMGGAWVFPGGAVHADGDADHAATAVRELEEEAAIGLRGQPATHGVFFNNQVSRRDHVVVYVVRDFAVIGEKIADREIAAAGFFPLDNLPPDTTQATRRRLAEILEGREPAPTW